MKFTFADVSIVPYKYGSVCFHFIIRSTFSSSSCDSVVLPLVRGIQCTKTQRDSSYSRLITKIVGQAALSFVLIFRSSALRAHRRRRWTTVTVSRGSHAGIGGGSIWKVSGPNSLFILSSFSFPSSPSLLFSILFYLPFPFTSLLSFHQK